MSSAKKKSYYGYWGLGAYRREDILRLAAEACIDLTTAARAIHEGVDSLCSHETRARVALAAGCLHIKLPKKAKAK